MGLIPETASPQISGALPVPAPEVTPSLYNTVTSAFNMENDISNFMELAKLKEYPADPNFSRQVELEKRGLWEQRDLFVGARSLQAFDQIAVKLEREQHDRNVLSRSGWAGVAAQFGAGAISPTSFIPFYRGASMAKSLAKGALSVGVGVAAQEAVLYGNQVSRTKEEVAYSLGFSTLLGGVLGGAAHGLSKAEFDSAAKYMAEGPDPATIPRPLPLSSDLSAADAGYVDPGGLKKGLLGSNELGRMSPIARGIEQYSAPEHVKAAGGSKTLREVTLKFGQGGLTLEGNVDGLVGAPGGNVESRVKAYVTDAHRSSVILEEAYVNSVYGTEAPKYFAKSKAEIAALINKNQMNYDELKREVFLSIANGHTHENPVIKKAGERLTNEVLQPLFDEAVKVGIFTGNEKIVGDQAHIHRVYRNDVLRSRGNEFVDIVSNHFETKLNASFAERLSKLNAKMSKDKTFFEDAARPAEEAAALRKAFKEDLKKLNDDAPVDFRAGDLAIGMIRNERDVLLDTVKDLREQLKELRSTPDDGSKISRIEAIEKDIEKALADREKKKAEIQTLKDQLGQPYEEFDNAVGEVKQRLKNLSQAQAVLEERYAKKLEKIDNAEELQLKTLQNAAAQIRKLRNFAESITPKELKALHEKTQKVFDETAKKFHSLEEQIYRHTGSPNDTVHIEMQANDIGEKLDKLNERLDRMEIDPAVYKKELDDAIDLVSVSAAELMAKRTLRTEKLISNAKKLSPEEVAARMAERKAKADGRLPGFLSWAREAGADNVDLEKGTGDFKQYARDRSTDTLDILKGTERRLGYSDVIQAKRGTELARTLDIPSHLISDFLETDVERVASIYIRTLGADIELARAFGTTNLAEQFIRLTDEQNAALQAIEGLTDKKGLSLSQEAKEKLQVETNKFYANGRKDLEAMIERVRGVRGVPSDPSTWASRGYSMVSGLNVLRYMGGVVVASAADPGRIIQKHGLTRVFKHAVLPMIRDFKTLRMTQKEAKLAGIALDPVMHTRAHTMFDVFDDPYRGTLPERAIQFATSRMGILAGFDYWTSAMKQVSAGVTVGRVMDDIATIMDPKAGKRAVDKATEYLSSLNLDPDTIEIVWDQVTKRQGGGQVNGIWLPETDKWEIDNPRVKNALKTFRAGIAEDTDNTIVTPGLERPNMVDANIFNKAIFQFRSFGLSSTQKTLMAGLQHKDKAYLEGWLVSMGLGYVSYYLWAVAAGGNAYEEMMSAGIDKWTDEAISRSGQLGVFDEVQRTAQRLPATRNYASFSGTRSTRREGGDLLEGFLGPSFDLGKKLADVASGLDNPTQHTLHTGRQLIPFQNHILLRQILDKVEASTSLPEKRTP